MTWEQRTIIIMLLIPSLPATCLSGLAVLLILLPRAHTRQLRHRLAALVLWQWLKGSKISSILHDWLWRENNGKPYDYGKDSQEQR